MIGRHYFANIEHLLYTKYYSADLYPLFALIVMINIQLSYL